MKVVPRRLSQLTVETIASGITDADAMPIIQCLEAATHDTNILPGSKGCYMILKAIAWQLSRVQPFERDKIIDALRLMLEKFDETQRVLGININATEETTAPIHKQTLP